MITLSSRMQQFGPNIFQELERRRQELVAEGREIFNLSVGTPDFETEPHIRQALIDAAQEPENYHYALGDLPEMIQAVQGWYRRRYGVELAPEQIQSVYGSQEGIAHVAFPFCDPGDLVLVPDPGYPIFSFGPLMAGVQLVPIPLREENGFLVDFDAIDPEIARKAKMMVVSYPANPVCALANREFYEKLVAFAKQYNIMVIHDNAYSDLVLEGEPGISFLSIPGAMDVGVEFNSLSKTYNLTGARISFVLGNREMVSAIRTFRSQIDYGIFRPIQKAAVAALTGPQDSVERIRSQYRERSRALAEGLSSVGWPVKPSKATMFLWTRLPKGYTDSAKFAVELLDKAGVICVPGSNFGQLGEGFVRFALVQPPEEMRRLAKIIGESGIIKEPVYE